MKEINFSPYANNILDYLESNLVDVYNRKIEIKHSMKGDFTVVIDGVEYANGMSNIGCSYLLNQLRVGIKQ